MAPSAVLLLALIATSLSVHGTAAKRSGARHGLAAATPASGRAKVFDITKYGAKHKDKETEDETNSLNSLAVGKAWIAACHTTRPGQAARLVIPKGDFELGPTPFVGPCNGTITVDIQGTLKPNPDTSLYSESYWLSFENVDGVTITGKGSVDGEGQPAYDYCSTKGPDCSGHPNIMLTNVTNVVIEGVQSINPTFAHVFIGYSRNVTVRNMKMTAPEKSIRTDGVHILESQDVTVAGSIIATGTDCVTIVHGSKNIVVTDLNCGPGNGISIGSFYTLANIGTAMDNALNVEGVLVKKSTFTRTTNGTLTIKTLLGAKGNKVSAVTFEDLVMDHVSNPITIVQEDIKNPTLSPLDKTSESLPAKISDIHFRNIKGTSSTKELVNIACSPIAPCEGVEIADVDIVVDQKATPPIVPLVSCVNAKVIFNGKHDGINC